VNSWASGTGRGARSARSVERQFRPSGCSLPDLLTSTPAIAMAAQAKPSRNIASLPLEGFLGLGPYRCATAQSLLWGSLPAAIDSDSPVAGFAAPLPRRHLALLLAQKSEGGFLPRATTASPVGGARHKSLGALRPVPVHFAPSTIWS
jgi:hypothetical protein